MTTGPSGGNGVREANVVSDDGCRVANGVSVWGKCGLIGFYWGYYRIKGSYKD